MTSSFKAVAPRYFPVLYIHFPVGLEFVEKNSTSSGAIGLCPLIASYLVLS